MKGKVIKALGKYYTIKSNGDQFNCTLRGKIKSDKRLKKYSEPIAVGDVVDFELNDDDSGVINVIHKRKNTFTRKDKSRGREDIIASNLDQIVIIQSFKYPDLNLRFVDRLLVRGVKEHIKVILCVNKSDLSSSDEKKYINDYYNNVGLDIFIISALTEKGIKDFYNKVKGHTSIFVGYSGVGKSTILNKIFPGLELRTSDVSMSTGKGRHTTTNVEMVEVDEETNIIDTPGVREFGLMDIDFNELSQYFTDFIDHIGYCKFQPCTHDHEPDCAIKELVENGKIHGDRYQSYLNILHSLKEDYENRYK